MKKSPQLRLGRMHLLLDTENLLGGTGADADAVQNVLVRVTALVRAPQDCHTTIGASCTRTHFENRAAAPGARCVYCPGHDGADLALLAVTDEGLEDRFEEIVIGSGDGIFAAAARRLRLRGAVVTVVSRRDSLSRELARAASRVLFLDDDAEYVEMRRAA